MFKEKSSVAFQLNVTFFSVVFLAGVSIKFIDGAVAST